MTAEKGQFLMPPRRDRDQLLGWETKYKKKVKFTVAKGNGTQEHRKGSRREKQIKKSSRKVEMGQKKKGN